VKHKEMMKMEVGAIQFIKNGWGILKENFTKLLIGTIVYFIAVIFLSVLERIFLNGLALSIIGALCVQIFMFFFATGYNSFILKVIRKSDVGIYEIFKRWDVFLYVVVTAVITGIAIFLGIILFIIPGIIFGYMYGFAYFIAIEENCSPFYALDKSSKIVKGYKMDLFLCDIIAMIFVLLGMILLIIPGIIIAISYSLGRMQFYTWLNNLGENSNDTFEEKDEYDYSVGAKENE
jgi:hypothetical protein